MNTNKSYTPRWNEKGQLLCASHKCQELASEMVFSGNVAWHVCPKHGRQIVEAIRPSHALLIKQ